MLADQLHEFLGAIDDPKRFGRNLLFVLGIALVVHFSVLGFFWHSWEWRIGGTPDQWDDLCFNLVDTHTLGFHPFQPTVQRGPLFPMMEAPLYLLFGKNYLAWSICLLLFNVGTCCLLTITARRLWGSRVGLLAGLFYGMNVAIIYYTAKVEQVTSVLPMVVLWLYLFTYWERNYNSRWIPWVLGILTGLMFLDKTVYLPVPFISSLVLLWAERKRQKKPPNVTPIFIYLATTCLVVAPWTYRNYVVSKGAIIPVQNMFWELILQDMLYDDLNQVDHQNRADGALQDYFRAKQDAISVAHGVNPDAPPGSARPSWEVRKERAYREGAVQMMLANPARVLRIKVANLWHYWFRAENWHKTKLFFLMQVAPLLAGLFGFMLLIRYRRLFIIKYGLILIFVLWGEHCLVWGWGRLSLDLMPAVALIFALGLDAWASRIGEPTTR